ncbi:MAG: class I SAM-dependent methyltransferase [Candidatus Heimdallarchaeota archaeon]
MATSKEKRDKHFPNWSLDNPIRRLFGNSKQFNSYVKDGQVVADLGCGPGFYTLALADSVGLEGKVYAVDSNEKCIQSLEKKMEKGEYQNIETHASSASDLSFINDRTVDFVLANGLFCSMAPQYHEAAVGELQRILKPNGQAYISVAKGFISYVDQAKWEFILEGFNVEQRNDGFPIIGDRWAVVSSKK